MDTGTRPTRRRLDAQTRREMITTAAGAAFGAQPYEQVSMAKVAAEAGASEALVYRYYPSKAALFDEVITAIGEEQQAACRAAVERLPVGSEARELVRVALEAELDLIASGKTRPLYASGPVEATDVLGRLRDEQVTWLSGLPGTHGLDAYAVRGYLGFVRAAITLWVARGCPASERERICQAALTALFGQEAGRRDVRRSKFGRH